MVCFIIYKLRYFYLAGEIKRCFSKKEDSLQLKEALYAIIYKRKIG